MIVTSTGAHLCSIQMSFEIEIEYSYFSENEIRNWKIP